MKLGIYGGTFDPVHLGHLILAETVREEFALDEVCFVPAFQNPHKPHAVPTPGKLRMEMLRFAISGNAYFSLSDFELKRKGSSYTIDTLRAIQAERHPTELYLLVGADSLADLPNWREPDSILQLATIVGVNRSHDTPGVPASLNRERVRILQMPAIDISASQIRERRRQGRSIRYITPRAVELFIEANQLYQAEVQKILP